MSLSGNLGFVSLDEVLRLLTRSKQRGAVDVRGEKVRGRIYVNKGGIGLATTFDDESLQRHLVKSGLIGEDDLQSERVAAVAEQDGGALVALLREMSVEGIYQLGLQGESFEVYEDDYTPLASPKAFDLEDLLVDSKQRLNDWAEVSQIISNLDRTLRFHRDLGDRDEVKIDKDAWKVLSEIGNGRSVKDIAEQIGTTDFWTARIAARLVQEELVHVERVEQVRETPTPTPSWDEPVAEEVQAEDVETEDVQAAELETAETAMYAESAESVDPNQSWWTEPQPEEDGTPEADEVEHGWEEAEEAEEAEEVEEQVEPAAEGDGQEVEEDTEAFLEKVFSELESTEEAEEGYGLLRRRRMGAMRDISNDA